uniref:Uncharacterized protein n=1 Tax=Chromera velia CCMP2878 TaxID=1169474 RepID=A0A0K6S7P8_9ALVE|eukprot:Cvel_4548.t1-p1 / transcript=Cvel_4548.t1 / gene=Cvel_4548 / organism=Chromera_velia_CCMP2878 / gene_product=hypothetical protein / transcript_product=hypothetical protein / location=Cvel_scaffold199:78518-78925(-) / protein_length=136 / sequence_SO=supercontig / SO=protein_coding / is_pseudo=false
MYIISRVPRSMQDSVVTGTLTSSFRKKEGLGKKSGSRVNFNLPPELPPDPPPGLERSSILSVSSGGGFKRTPTGGLGLGARSSSFGGVESSTSLKSLKGRRDAFFGDMLLDPPPGKGGKPMRAVDSVQVGPSEKRR